MSIPLRFRIQEWFADRFDGVQYPVMPTRAAKRPFVEFKHKMPLWQRLVVIQWALAMLIVGSAMLVFGCFVAWIALKAIFTF